MHCQKCPEAKYNGETGGNSTFRFNNHRHYQAENASSSAIAFQCRWPQLLTTVTWNLFRF